MNYDTIITNGLVVSADGEARGRRDPRRKDRRRRTGAGQE